MFPGRLKGRDLRTHDGQQLRKGLLKRLGAGVHGKLRLAIKRGATRQNAFQVVHRLWVGLHGAGVTLCHDAAHVVFRRRLQPNGGALAQQLVKGRWVRDQAAGRGDDDGRVALNGLRQGALFVASVSVETI